MEDVPLEIRNMWVQQEGCPAHSSLVVLDFLNFPNKWIGRGSLFHWPARSPDLTCIDFYLWGKVKNIVYETPSTTHDDIITRILNAINSIPRAEIEAAVFSSRRRLNRCIENNGRQFEQREMC